MHSRIPEESMDDTASLDPENILSAENIFHPLFLNNVSEIQQNGAELSPTEISFLVSAFLVFIF